jgi:SAM-dependent methyltransferase
MKQKTVFLEQGEADAWFTRNLGSLGKYDPVTPLIEEMGLKPKYVLEVGCANGWRLAKLRDKFGCGIVGIEPSMKAGIDGARLHVPIHQMTANCLPVTAGGYDMIIYGFCLYLTDPEDWLNIAAEGDRALADGGHLIIHDFNGWIGGKPIAKPYEHRLSVRSYHYDFSRLWLGHPRYQVVKAVDGAHDDAVMVLRKNQILESIRTIP